MVMSFTATDPMPEGVVSELTGIIDGMRGLGLVEVGETLTTMADGIHQASVDVTLVGEPSRLLEVEEGYANMARSVTVTADHPLGQSVAGSVVDLVGRADISMVMAVLGWVLVAACLFLGMWPVVLGFGGLFAVLGPILLHAWQGYQPFVL